MHVKKILKALMLKQRQEKLKFETKYLCGIPLKVLKGTIRETVDQDDAWWFYLSKHHHVIFDIGCNIGYMALLALIQDSNKQLLLVDPNPKALQKAAINLIQNNLGNKAQYFTAFVGDTLNEKMKFYTIGSGEAGSMYSSHAESAAAINSYMEVNTVTLDFLYAYYELKPDLVKIDVEGAETLVMKAAKKMALETQCTFFIEMHDVKDLGMEAAGEMILDWCKEVQYKAWYLKMESELIDANTIKGRGKCHLLLMPFNRPYPDYLKGVAQKSHLPKSI